MKVKILFIILVLLSMNFISANYGAGEHGILNFTTTTKTYGNLVLNQDYTVSGNTLYLMLNKPYNFSYVYLGTGTTLSTQNTSGVVLILNSNDTITINGNITLSNVLLNGNRSEYYQFDNIKFNHSGSNIGGNAGSGAGGCSGGSTLNGFGGGGCGGFSNRYSVYFGGAGGSGNYPGGTGGSGVSGGSGTAGSNSSGGGGSGQAGSTGGNGGNAYSSNGNDATGDFAGGGGGSGGISGKAGVNLYINSPTVNMTNSKINLSGSTGGNGGNGGRGYHNDPHGSSTGTSYGGSGGGGGAGGNSANIYINSFNLVNNSNTFLLIGGTAGKGGIHGNGYKSIDELSTFQTEDGYNGTNGSVGNVYYTVGSFFGIIENSQTYNSISLSEKLETFTINISIDGSSYTIGSINLTYNNTKYSADSINNIGTNYIASKSINVPSVSSTTTKQFYWTIGITNSSGTYYFNSTTNNQSIETINISTNCTGGFNFINITNRDEESLNYINGTVEYILQLYSSVSQILSISGSVYGSNISLCSNANLSEYYLNYNLQLRYYGDNYAYETYNIQDSEVTNLPINIPLYFLNESSATEFKIFYTDFNYLTYPNAIMQIQRQYISTDTYNVVEIPKLDNNGNTRASFNKDNIRYKIIVINNGEVLDTFNDVFPSCQNIILGTCELYLRGEETTATETVDDFTYTLSKTNTSLILTYVIPSGTPRTISLLTNQNSRFINNISTCNNSIFASGGTIECSYNNTIGDSIIDTEIVNSDGSNLYGSVYIPEDLADFYLLNNYVIAFILLLLLGLIFISSGIMIIISSVAGLIYLGLIFLLKGASLTTIAGSIAWLIVASGLAIYKISKKEERT